MINLIINNFTDFNYLSPLIIFANKQKIQEVKTFVVLNDLKKERKSLFREESNKFLNFPFIKSANVKVLNGANDLKGELEGERGIILTTTPTFYQLFNKKIIKRKFFGKNPIYVGFGYFNEFVKETAKKLDLIFFSAPIENIGIKEKKVRYGLPYWDFFGSNSDFDFSYLDNLPVRSTGKNIVIPEIMQDGDSWLEQAYQYIVNNYSVNNNYYFKLRLKTLASEERAKKLEEKLASYQNIFFTHSPYFFTTVNLLRKCDEVVFTSNASLFVIDCMAAGAKIVNLFDKPRMGLWKIDDYHYVCNNYVLSPEETKKKHIARLGDCTENLFKEIAKL